jgi:hypothetical protein
MWRLTTRALDFLRGQVPFEEMQVGDALATGNASGTLAKRGEFYLSYLKFGGAFSLDLEGNVGPYECAGSTRATAARCSSAAWRRSAARACNRPAPRRARRLGGARAPRDSHRARDRVGAGRVLRRRPRFRARGARPRPERPGRHPGGHGGDRRPHGRALRQPALPHRGGTLYSLFLHDTPAFAIGTWHIHVSVQDSSGLSVVQSVTFKVH